MCMNHGGRLNFWHVLEVLIVARLGFDALPETPEAPDRAEYMSRMFRVIHRQIAAEKIQSAFLGRRERFRMMQVLERFLDRKPTQKEVGLVSRIRRAQRERCKLEYQRGDRLNREGKGIKKVWRASIKSFMQRANAISVKQGSEHLIHRAVQITDDNRTNQRIDISHPIVLVKAYRLTTKEATFDRKRLELCIERVLQATKNSEAFKNEVADLTIKLLESQGLYEPYIFDIRQILTKVCTQTVHFRG